MMKNKRISVLLVSYNEIKYIEKAISSILSQHINDFSIEIIIGDDGSDDGSIEFIQNFCREIHRDDISAHYFVMDRPNNGDNIIPSIRVSNIIKKALELATGDYITCLSADDFFCDDNKFLKAINFLNNNPQFFSYVTGYKKIGLVEEKHNIKYFNEISFLSLHYIHISCFVFRHIPSDLLMNRFCDDIGFEYSLYTFGRWKFDDSISFAYVQHNDSIMHSSKKIELYSLDVLFYQDVVNFGFDKHILRAVRARVFRSFLEVFKARNQICCSMLTFKKYLENSSCFNHDYYNRIVNYNSSNVHNKLYVLFMILTMGLDRAWFVVYLFFLNKLFNDEKI